MSACFPGLGQIYNRKYWKAPVIYAAIGGLGYWGVTNQIKYKYYSDNLRAANDDDPSTVNSTLYSSDQLITQKKYYQKYLNCGKEILLVGVSFDLQERNIKEWKSSIIDLTS